MIYWDIRARYTGEVEDYSVLDNQDGGFDVDEDGKMVWNKYKSPEPHPLGKQRVVELSWGWTPFGEPPENYADDAPVGHESVFILEHQLPDLIERLQALCTST